MNRAGRPRSSGSFPRTEGNEPEESPGQSGAGGNRTPEEFFFPTVFDRGSQDKEMVGVHSHFAEWQ